ncbi:MAG: zinc ribbon domain-containing protein [Halobacteriota archaeon]|nr:zinc ribbon domain-containing protein [Halobacteriota archaeon]
MVDVAETIDCPNCGAPLPLKAGEVIITCEYCGSAHNMAVGKKFFLKHSIIPNNYISDDIARIVKEWMGGGFLKPDDLVKRSEIQEIDLTFLPFFVISVVAYSRYEGVFTRTGENISKTGELKRAYNWKILGRRGSKFPTKEYEIPLSGKVDFDLSRISKEAKFLNAEMDEGEAKSMLEGEIDDHNKYLLSTEVDVIKSIETTLDVNNTEFVHAPVWEVRYEYVGKSYEMMLDGASGTVIRGDIPPPDTSTKGFFKSIRKGFFR